MGIKINNLEYWVQKVLPQVYDDSLSFQELLYKVIAKLNEVIEEVNDYFSEDLSTYVGELLEQWYLDGRFADIITEQVLTDIDRRLEDIVVNVKDFWEEADGNDLSKATQRAINSIGNAVTNGATVLLPRGNWDWSTPVVIDQKDGLTVEGSGRWATKLNAVGTLQYVDSLGYPDSYTTKAFFIVTKRRVTGGTDGVVNPSGANSHSWFVNFKGMSFHAQGYPKQIDGVFTHGMAHCRFEQLFGEHLRYGVNFGNGGVYRCTALDCDWANSVNGFKNVKGTTFNAMSCGYQRTDEGWEIDAHYTALTNCAIDHWGFGKYAYTLKGIGVVLNGCGLEKGLGGGIKIDGDRTSVTFNGFNEAGGMTPGTPEFYTGQKTAADFGVTDFSVIESHSLAIFNGCTFRQEVWPDGTSANIVHLPFRVKANARVLVNLVGDRYGATPSMFKADLDGEVIISDNDYKINASYSVSANKTVANDTNYTVPLETKHSDSLAPLKSGNEYVIPSNGRYQIDVNLIISGTDFNYAYLLNSRTGSYVFEEAVGTLNGRTRLTYSLTRDFKANDRVSLVLRTNPTSNLTLIKGSAFTVTKI
jgi:hypothetical protein